jgi:RNA polymerase sigma factor (sigma-70 family)
MPVFRGRPDLLERFRAGDRDALEVVYRAYVARVSEIAANGFRIASTGGAVSGFGRGTADLADTVQEIFLKAFARTARLSFDGSRDFGPYLASIARNVMIDRARRSGREILLPEIDLDRASSSAVSDPFSEIPARWEDPAAIAVARRFIDELPPELAHIHRLLYVEGQSQREAAVTLGIGRQALRTLDGKLRAGLRQRLSETQRPTTINAENRAHRGSLPDIR